MALSNEEIIAKVKEKLDKKNNIIRQKEEEIDRLKEKNREPGARPGGVL